MTHSGYAGNDPLPADHISKKHIPDVRIDPPKDLGSWNFSQRYTGSKYSHIRLDGRYAARGQLSAIIQDTRGTYFHPPALPVDHYPGKFGPREDEDFAMSCAIDAYFSHAGMNL